MGVMICGGGSRAGLGKAGSLTLVLFWLVSPRGCLQVELRDETGDPNKCVSLCRRGECWLSVHDDASRRARLFHWSDD